MKSNDLFIDGGDPLEDPPGRKPVKRRKTGKRRKDDDTKLYAPYPVIWLKRLASADKNTLKLANFLIYRRFRQMGPRVPICVSGVGAAEFGVKTRQQRQRALAELIKIGLVSLVPGLGKNQAPQVRLNQTKGLPP
jgi:hypothetical protein